jgi:hypothetical protein
MSRQRFSLTCVNNKTLGKDFLLPSVSTNDTQQRFRSKILVCFFIIRAEIPGFLLSVS